ncbi:magnesium transporter [Thermodesulfovibrio sp.]|uniref:magnesium transporter n=1 Tax=Thermodesulfovibrio sp. TaxID=2067987 RepID=UPI0030A8FA2C
MKICQVLKEMVEKKNWEGVKWAIVQMSPATIVECFREMETKYQALVFRFLSKRNALHVFELLERVEQIELVRALEDPEIVKLIEAMEPDERVNLLEELPAKVVKRILLELSSEARASVNLLLGYPENSAGRVMNPNYLALPENTTVSAALEKMRQSPLKPEHLEVVFVLGEGRLYKGYVTVTQLLKAPEDKFIGELIENEPVAVSAYDSQDKVAELFIKKQYPLVAVLDKEKRLVGAIDTEKGLELVQEFKAQQLTVFGGTVAMGGPDIDIVNTSLSRIFKARVFWLIILTFFGILTSKFVAEQEEILSSVLVLAAFIPPIIDMGGNTGSQSATMVIRAMALGQVSLRVRDILFVLKRDIPVAIAMGVVIGLLETLLAYFSKGVGTQILMVVGLSMITVTIVGSLIGVFLPFIARRFGFDPATLSSPVITSVMDLIGVFIYFGFAYMFLSELLVK